MSIIKKQLREFYRRQGLTGKHLRSAMRWDMKAAKANAVEFAEEVYEPIDLGSISRAFEWSATKQGHFYWAYRSIPVLIKGRLHA